MTVAVIALKVGVVSTQTINLINEIHDNLDDDDRLETWALPGVRKLDISAAAIADFYLEYPAERDTIRTEIPTCGSLWGLVLFVRRVGLLLDSGMGMQWLNRGLAVASIIDANCDNRDLIVSLVVLRSLAMDAGFETDDAFDAAISWSSDRMHGILINARNHKLSDIHSTVASFGPPMDTG